jgi:hypothetical protein
MNKVTIDLAVPKCDLCEGCLTSYTRESVENPALVVEYLTFVCGSRFTRSTRRLFDLNKPDRDIGYFLRPSLSWDEEAPCDQAAKIARAVVTKDE